MHTLRLFNSTYSSTKLIIARKWGAVSPSTCVGGRLAYAPGSLLASSQPAACAPTGNTCTLSLKLQNTENTELPGADMLLS